MPKQSTQDPLSNHPESNEKKRYFEPAPQDIDVDNFRKVVESRRSVRKFTDKAIPADVLDACLDLANFKYASRASR